jgi:hypothetical protein
MSDNQLLMVELKAIAESPRTWRVIPNFSQYLGSYRDEASVAISTTGSTVWWTGNWGDATTGHGEVYTADISGWYEHFSGVSVYKRPSIGGKLPSVGGKTPALAQ